MTDDLLQDVRARSPAERLLEETWAAGPRRASRRELIGEAACGLAFLTVAGSLAAGGPRPDGWLCVLFVVLVAVFARTVRFPVGAGHVVPTYLVLVPMLLLIGPELSPLLLCAGQVLGSLVRCVLRRSQAREILFSVPDAWHAIGPAVVLTVAGPRHGTALVAVYGLAFLAGCLVDFVSSTLREWIASGIAPQVQGHVVLTACLLDACFAPLGYGIAVAARHDLLALLLLVPLGGLLAFSNRDRTARIARAQERLEALAGERARLRATVQRLGDAFAARLDLGALAEVLLRSSAEAVDAATGRLVLGAATIEPSAGDAPATLIALLADSCAAARRVGRPVQIGDDASWALAVPVAAVDGRPGVLALARGDRPFDAGEQQLVSGLVARAEVAAADIVAHGHLQRQLRIDPLTALGNRRGLAEALDERLPAATPEAPLVLAIFDLDGFKHYNDTHGHMAGDALLVRLARRLEAAVGPSGAAFRLGGDEFCALLPAGGDIQARLSLALDSLGDGDLDGNENAGAAVRASCGSVELPSEASTAAAAMQLADERMYAHKHGRRVLSGPASR